MINCQIEERDRIIRIFEKTHQFIPSLRFQSDSPPRKPSHVCHLTDDFTTHQSASLNGRFRRIFSAVSPGSEQRLLPASFCDRLIKMGGRLVQPVCAAASCGISDCASRFWKKRVSVHVIIACRVSDLPFATSLYTLEHQNLCAIRGGR